MRKAWSLFAIAVAVVGASCGADQVAGPSASTGGDVAMVVVNPTSASVTISGQTTLQAVAQDAGGAPISGASILWSVRDPNIASVSQSGVVTGLAIGNTQISASSKGKSGVATLSVQRVPVASVVVSPTQVDAGVGSTTQLSVSMLDGARNTLAGRPVTWSSSNVGVATVSSTGVVTGVGPGTSTVSATSESISASITVTIAQGKVQRVVVTPTPVSMFVGHSTQLASSARDASDGVVVGRPVSWASSNAAVATVTQQGVVTSVGAGAASITATIDGVSGSSSLSVELVPVASVGVSPQNPTLHIGSTIQLATDVRDAAGAVLLNRPVSWTTSNPSVASVSTNGVVTGISTGTASITATVEGKSGSTTASVTVVPVAATTVTGPATLRAGETGTFTATMRGANSVVLVNRPVSWSSSNSQVATVTQAGVVTAVAVGTATITATSEGKSGSASLAVTAASAGPTNPSTGAPVATVGVGPQNSTVVAGGSIQLSADVRDGSGGSLANRVVTWSTSNPAIATVASTGLVTGIATGTVTITATSETKSGTTTVVVTPVPVATTTVGGPASLQVGESETFRATLRGANNLVLTNRAVTWSSSNTQVATVSATGIVKALAVGSTTITALSEGVSGSTSLAVVAPIPVAPVPVATVAVTPQNVALLVGGSSQLVAAVRDANGAALTNRVVTWSSNDPLSASVSSTGLVTAVGPGTAIITATSETKDGTTTVTVAQVPVASVSVSGPAALQVGQTGTFAATTRDASNAVLANRLVSWTSSNTQVASVSPTGIVTPLSAGSTTITATSEGIVGSAPLVVSSAPVGSVSVSPQSPSLTAGTNLQLSADVRDVNGVVVTDRAVSWSSSDPLVASVSSTGVVTGVAAGTVTITATSESRNGSTSVTVTPVPVASVSVTGPASLQAGQTGSFSGTVRDASGNVLANRPVVWSSSNMQVATIDQTGAVTAVAAGSTTITATSGGVTGTAQFDVTAPPPVTPVPVGTVAVTPQNVTLVAGGSSQLAAVVRDANGLVVTDRAVAWSTSDPAIATVSGTGAVTAVGAGSAVITATSETKSGTTTVTVSAAPVASTTVTGPATLQAGQSGAFTATMRDANNVVLSGRAVAWSSSNTQVATIDQAGAVTAVTAGSTTITAISEGVSGSAPLDVTAPPVVTPVPVGSVAVSSQSPSVAAGGSVQLSADVRDANGVVVTDRPVTWTTSDPLIATVSSAGVVSGVAAGTVTITATSETKSGTATITVTPAPVAPVASTTVSGPATLQAGQTGTFTATMRDASNTVLSNRSVTWSSSNTQVATVDQTGAVTAVAVGSTTITALSEGITGTATLDVTAPPVVTPVPVGTVVVTPQAPALLEGGTVQISAEVRDANGVAVTDRVVTWSSSDALVATVSSTGVVTAVAAGTADITATSETKTGSTTVTVTQPPVASVSVAGPASLQVGQTGSFTTTLRDASNAVLTNRAVIWGTSDAQIATITQAGVVTAVAAGTVSVTATSEGQTGTASLTIATVPLGMVRIQPPASSLTAGQSTTLIATVTDANAQVVASAPVAWSTSNSAIAAVSSSGVVTTAKAGTATITASSGTLTGTATVSVNPGPVASVQFTPPGPFTRRVGQNGRLTVAAYDSFGNQVANNRITWTTSDSNVASINPTGQIMPRRTGTVTITAAVGGVSADAVITVVP